MHERSTQHTRAPSSLCGSAKYPAISFTAVTGFERDKSSQKNTYPRVQNLPYTSRRRFSLEGPCSYRSFMEKSGRRRAEGPGDSKLGGSERVHPGREPFARCRFAACHCVAGLWAPGGTGRKSGQIGLRNRRAGRLMRRRIKLQSRCFLSAPLPLDRGTSSLTPRTGRRPRERSDVPPAEALSHRQRCRRRRRVRGWSVDKLSRFAAPHPPASQAPSPSGRRGAQAAVLTSPPPAQPNYGHPSRHSKTASPFRHLRRQKHLVMGDVRQNRQPVPRHVLTLPAGVLQPAAEQLIEPRRCARGGPCRCRRRRASPAF